MFLPFPTYISTNMEASDLDKLAIEHYGYTGLVLMEIAAHSIFHKALEEFPELQRSRKKICVLCGTGNNGGDGFVLARLFHIIGHEVNCFIVGADSMSLSHDTAHNLRIAKSLGIPSTNINNNSDPLPDLSDVFLVVDAIFGTGLKRTIEDPYQRVLSYVADAPKTFKVLSVDIPSGLSGDSGLALGPVIPADLTVSLSTLKKGFFQNRGVHLTGKLLLGDIGLSSEIYLKNPPKGTLADLPFIRGILPKRTKLGHKGTFGHTVVCGGSPGKSGALVLAALGALRSGAGLITALHPKSLKDVMETKLTSSMTLSLPETKDFQELNSESIPFLTNFLKDKKSFAIGPGLGLSEGARDLCLKVPEIAKLPLVVDADALTNISGHLETLKGRNYPTVISPHPGEAARLLKIDPEDIERDRFGSALELSKLTGAVVLLKGYYTIVMEQTGRFSVNTTGNSVLASGGSGDLLTGLIAGLLGRGMEPFEASILAAFVHGRAAEIASQHLGPYGVSPTEIQPFIPKVWEELHAFDAASLDFH